MATEGIEGIYVETHNWGRTAKFFQELGFEIEFETDHGSGMLRCGAGPYVLVEEVPANQALQLQVLVRVGDATTCRPGPPVEVVKPFEDTHWGYARNARSGSGWSHLEPAGTADGAAVTNMDRLEEVVARLPQAERVDVEAWDGEPTFRVSGKTFIFSSADAGGISVKLPKEEAAAVVATDPDAEPTGYGLGRHGWVSVTIPTTASGERWREIEEWIRTSYTLIAPKRLARAVLEQDEQPG